MGDDTTQRAVHRFLSERLVNLEPFTKKQLGEAAGWSESSLDTYWSKQFKNLFDDLGDGTYRVRGRFRRYLDWKKFRQLVTQVKAGAGDYEKTVYTSVVAYEFYMPLAHENALRLTLDSLFYKDAVLPRLRLIGVPNLEKIFPKLYQAEPNDGYIERVRQFFEQKFGGYSIYHVDGRFRASGMLTFEEAAGLQKLGQRYLVDETTAVTRFIFPCKADEPKQVRFLFEEVFVKAVTELVSGEDEIWVIESGERNQVHIWKPGEN